MCVNVTRQVALLMNLGRSLRDIRRQTAGEIAEGVRVGLGGEVVSEFWQGQRNYGIQVRQAEPFRTDLAQIAALPLTSPSGEVVSLDQVARIEQRRGPSIIRRENVVRRIAVKATLIYAGKAATSARRSGVVKPCRPT